MQELKTFKFWCQKVLPLVYDEALSYYEVLCKVVDYINNLIADNKIVADELESIKSEISTIQNWIDNFDYENLENLVLQWLSNSLAKMITVGINQDGYIVYYIPQSWNDITFNTTGLDINLSLEPEYGHLVLSY